MIGIILVSHGKLAEGILDSGKMIYDNIDNVKTVILSNMDGINNFSIDLKETIRNFDGCNEILIMCDLQGGSPFNLSLQYAIENNLGKNIKVVSGLNLPMFLEVLALRDTSNINELIDIAYESGRNGIMIPNLTID